MEDLKNFCDNIYETTYTCTVDEQKQELITKSHGKSLSQTKLDEIEVSAQKEAIKQSVLKGIREFPTVEVEEIWKTIYEIHVHRKSGIDNAEIITKVISADQSWKKSSGHAFEEMVKFLASVALKDTEIEIILQRDLNILIKANELGNEPRDISWLKEQVKGNVFDLYATLTHENKKYCFGCIQAKTSVRDRVTRDREPSIAAMKSFFWSTIFVLDGTFLKLPKFVAMVNGGTTEFKENGWHSMFVFSEKYSKDRIFSTDLDLKHFKEQAIEAADFWLKQRQWFNQEWKTNCFVEGQ